MKALGDQCFLCKMGPTYYLHIFLLSLSLQSGLGQRQERGKERRKCLSVNVLKLFQDLKSLSSNSLLPSPLDERAAVMFCCLLDEKRSRDQLPEDETQCVRARFQGIVAVTRRVFLQSHSRTYKTL